jgi:hypothetical protein
MYGHVAKLADEIKKGASSVEGVEAKIWQVGTYLLCCTNFFFFNNKHETCVSSILRKRIYFLQNLKTGKTGFVSITDSKPVVKSAETDSTENAMRWLTDAYYETARYLLFNNKRKKLPSP